MQAESATPEIGAVLVVAAVTVVVVLLLQAYLVRSLLVICRPSEWVVINGRSSRQADGSVAGYRILAAGRSFRIPVVEEAHRLDRRLLPIEVCVQNAYARGGGVLEVRLLAGVKVTSNPGEVRHAVERFLCMSPREISNIAEQTLEGVTREFVAGVTPEQLSDERMELAERLGEECQREFGKLGLQLDILNIVGVADRQGYFEGLSRARLEAARRAAGQEAET